MLRMLAGLLRLSLPPDGQKDARTAHEAQAYWDQSKPQVAYGNRVLILVRNHDARPIRR